MLALQNSHGAALSGANTLLIVARNVVTAFAIALFTNDLKTQQLTTAALPLPQSA